MARSPAPKKQQRSPLMPFYLILGVVALVGLGLLARQMMAGGGTAAKAPVPVTMDPAQLAQVQGISVGRADAPVQIFEFADFQCPGCGEFARFVSPIIKERYVQAGTVRYVYYDFPLPMHPHAFLASRAARCANEQGKFWEYHDVLYGRQSQWSPQRDATDSFIEYARDIQGLDQGPFRDCVRSDRYAREVTENIKLGESLGVNGTPTVFINGKRLPNVPGPKELDVLIQQEVGAPTATE
ncbi:MAG: thioredoxin domain-containing protein [Gemmatimonadetes bacterium]|nr:thioredoxin domain-containing protein [Gemmatimonadota bacterium]